MNTERSSINARVSESGVTHWRYQRYSAVALVPLCLWFIISVVQDSGRSYSAALNWLESPLTAGRMILGFLVLYLHTMLGVQAVVEDYVAETSRRALLVQAVRWVSGVMSAISVLAVLVVAMG